MATKRKHKLSKPMPKAARPVALILRRDVPKPARRRFDYIEVLRTNDTYECPMGLHPAAENGAPSTRAGFPPASGEAVYSFSKWWDKLGPDDLGPALDAIWGRRRR